MELYGTKTCPQCGQELFDDMDVCYGCLYSFEEASARAVDQDGCFPDLDEVELDGDLSAVRENAGLKLRISTGDALATIEIPKDGLVIGRDALSDVVLKSRAVSKRHARVIPLSGGAIVENLGATNPILFKGREVGETALVRVGESFDICGTRLTVVS